MPETVPSLTLEPEQLWLALDSFWRTHADATTESLVHYQSYANSLILANQLAKAQHILGAQYPGGYSDDYVVPWMPVVIRRSQLRNLSFILYGDGLVYTASSSTRYGDSGAARWLAATKGITGIGGLCDAVVESSRWFGPASFSFDSDSGVITFTADPFTLFPVRTLSGSGEQYIVVWLKSVRVTHDWLYEQVGRVIGLPENKDTYATALAALWRTVVGGLSFNSLRVGFAASLALPVAERTAEVSKVSNDGYRTTVLFGEDAVSFQSTLGASVGVGTTVRTGDSLSNALKWATGSTLSQLAYADLPGLSLSIPLSTGRVAELFFPNQASAWTYSVSRPGPWRFTVLGEAADVEAFWVDSAARQAAAGVSFATLFGLTPPGPGPAINPAQFIASQLFSEKLLVAAVKPGLFQTRSAYVDRVRAYLPDWLLFIIQQDFGAAVDSYDAGVQASDTASAFYNATPTVDSITVPDLADYTPLVTST